ncbi:uncharacterized protein LOC122794997 [Protopterus annectens]|uniref:uncharacterized protein LOC122794997 n=1 Tax=Protopterus annectens TaxID=7888 RepID=UPI001CF9D44A|nr:uncharacterized protein LOC122794997 [Protopterus annectens]
MNTPQKMPFPTVFVRKRSCTVSSSPVNDCSNIKIAQMNEAVPLLKSDMAVPNQTDEHVLSVAGEHTLSSKQIFMGEEIINQKSKTETAIQSNIKGKIHKIKAIIKSDLKGEAERNAKIPQEKIGLLSRVKMGVFTAGIVKIRLKKQKKNNKKKNMLKNKSSKSKSAIHTRERDLETAASGHLTSEQSGRRNCAYYGFFYLSGSAMQILPAAPLTEKYRKVQQEDSHVCMVLKICAGGRWFENSLKVNLICYCIFLDCGFQCCFTECEFQG